MRPIPEDTINNIKSLLLEGLSTREVAVRLGVSQPTIARIKKKHLPELQVPKKGRKEKLSAQDKRYCVRAITSGGLDTAVSVAKSLKKDIKVNVSRQTVARALHAAGMKSMEKEKKPMLSVKAIKARLEFAKIHKDWTVEDWKRVIWSDETKINRFCSDGREWCWIRDSEQIQPRHVQQTVKHGGGSIMLWGCMTCHGPGFACKIDGTMDQVLYKNILEDELLHTIEYYGMDAKQVIFQHDNDPKHKAKSVQEWLSNQEFQVLSWPSSSPDLNPIEHLWSHLKRQLNKYETPSKGMLEHWDRIQCEWDKIDQTECMKLIESMPRRILAVIKSKGQWTKY